MCRNIKTLFNFDPPATHAEIHASALQFVRKLSGFNSPSQANAEAFNRAVSEVSDSARRLLAVAADQRGAARPRGRGREGEGALAGAVRLGPINLSTYSVEPNTMTRETVGALLTARW